MTLTLKHNALERIERDIFRKAAVRALNRTAKSVKSQASKVIREVYNIKARDLDPYITVRIASISNMMAVITARGTRLPLIEFASGNIAFGRVIGKSRGAGVRVRVKKAGGGKVVRGSFVAMMGSGHTGVFKRAGKARLPINELTTISVADMFAAEAVHSKLAVFAKKKLQEELESQTRFLLTGTSKQAA